MKASELIHHLNSFLTVSGDCEVRLYPESIAYHDCYDDSAHEVITDIRVVRDWPLPGESIIFGNAEECGQYLVFFYDAHEDTAKRLKSKLSQA